MSLHVTQHSLMRAKERAGYNERYAIKMAEKALERGIRSVECQSSADRRYLESKSSKGRIAIAYNGWCYIFDQHDNSWITILELPKDFGKRKCFFRSEKVNSVSVYRYMKKNYDYVFTA